MFASHYVGTDLGFDAAQIIQTHIDDMFTRASGLLIAEYLRPALAQTRRCDETVLTVLTPERHRIPVVVNARMHPRDEDCVCWTILRAEKRHKLHDALLRSHELLEKRANRLRKLASTDELTGLFNRREFLKRAGESLTFSAQNGTSVALVIADVDHFKRVNDTFGHDAGDDVLRELAHRLRHACRAGELLARYGGEEFSFCLEGLSLAAVRGFAQRMHQVASEVRAPDKPISISMGIGLHFDGTGKTLTQTLKEADDALYAAKQAGRNRTFILDGEKLITGT